MDCKRSLMGWLEGGLGEDLEESLWRGGGILPHPLRDLKGRHEVRDFKD